MALVRVYCGLTSTDPSTGRASATPELAVAVVDDAGRLIGVQHLTDDPAGYAWLGSYLVERSAGLPALAVAADSDDHLLTSLLTAAGRPLAVADDDSVDDYAERFADDDSPEEMQAPPAHRRAVGLARALQAGALSATTTAASRELVSHKPILAAHAALLTGRHAAATTLREVLRELYPAALRAYPDPARPLPMAVLAAVPEPGRLQGGPGRREGPDAAEEVVRRLTVAGVADPRSVADAVTALQVAISESPRRGGVNKSLATTVADTVTAAIDAVRANDTACAALVSSLAARVTTQLAPNPGRRSARRAAEDVPSGLQSRGEVDAAPTRVGRRSRPEPAAAGNGPAIPHPMTTPPVAPPPVAPPPVAPRPVAPRPASPPPIAPAAASGLPSRPASGLPSRPVSEPSSRPVSVPSSRPVSVPPPPPGIVPSARPGVPPAEAGEPFRPTLTNAAISSARAERQRTVIPPRPVIRPQEQPSEPATGGTPRSSVTDYSLPMPASRPASDAPPPGSRGNWPLVARAEDREVAAPTSGAAPVPPSGAGQQPAGSGRVRPPWQSDDLPAEPPSLRLVDQQLGTNDETTQFDGRALRLIEGEETERAARGRARRAAPTVTALDRSSAPPVPDEGDGDLLIFAAARSAWFVGQSDDSTPEWESTADTGWRAAEQAASPAVGAETAAGLPKRVPQANLVPGSPLRDERPLRIVRDAASIAAHTTGYFRGWRRGQEIGGYAIGGRPGRQAAGGWDFTRDGGSRDDDYRSAGYQS